MKTEKSNKMTVQEAIKKLKDFSSSFEMLGCESGVVAVAIEALEKQKSKKPIRCADGTEKCPNCDLDITLYGFGRCIDCGQVLDWS